ncbi:MAG: hypothetical protein ACODAU_07490 [Myxococcota bacterium]
MPRSWSWIPKLAILGAITAGVAVLSPPTTPAEALGLRAHVLLTQAKVPRRTSEHGLIRFARSHLARTLRETRDEKLTDRKWLANLVTAFNASPNDLEFNVVFNDIEGGKKRFVDSMSVFTSNRDQKTYVSKVKLERPQFEPNHRYELVVTVRRREVGRFRFRTAGEEKRNTGVVSFDDDES